MTVNHDVVGSSPTAGARDTLSECFFIAQEKGLHCVNEEPYFFIASCFKTLFTLFGASYVSHYR